MLPRVEAISITKASTAQWHADRAAQRLTPSKLPINTALRHYVQDRLAGKVTTPEGVGLNGPAVVWKGRRAIHRQSRRWSKAWSPEQIANRLRLDFPGDPNMRISHEAIYQALYIQGRGALRRDLTACLHSGRALRTPRERTRSRGKTFVGDAIMISDRPAEIIDRAVPGHWEGDLILGLGSSAIGTLVERTTRFTMLLHLPRMKDYQPGKRIKNDPAVAVQRGTNENTNGLLRQYFPKGTDLGLHTPDELNAVAHAINIRPRKTLSWKTSAESLHQFLRSYIQEGVATTG